MKSETTVCTKESEITNGLVSFQILNSGKGNRMMLQEIIYKINRLIN